MLVNKILIIDESPLFRDFLSKTLQDYGFHIITAFNGLDGYNKIYSETPDLIIMNFELSRKDSISLLEDRSKSPNVSKIPVIIISENVEKEKLLAVAQYGVKKFLTKPISIADLLSALQELLNVDIPIDETPSIVEAHMNDKIVFVEIARGLNREKLRLLNFKIQELLEIYNVHVPLILLMLTDIDIDEKGIAKLKLLLDDLREITNNQLRNIRVLTTSKLVMDVLKRYKGIVCYETLAHALKDFVGAENQQALINTQDQLLSGPENAEAGEGVVRLKADEILKIKTSVRKWNIAVVDDDPVVHAIVKKSFQGVGGKVVSYFDGDEFIGANQKDLNLICLDLMMPRVNGFQVLEHLRKTNISIPVIILSALGRVDTVLKAREYGVKSYLIKPIKPQDIIQKGVEILGTQF